MTLKNQQGVPLRAYRKYIGVFFLSFACVYFPGLLFVHSDPMFYESREYPMWLHVKEQMNSSTESKRKMILIGDSRAKAGYEPNLAPFESLNLSVGGSTPLEGFYTLQTYLENNPAPVNLVLSYSPLHLTKGVYFWSRTVKYDFLNRKQYASIVGDIQAFTDPEIGEQDLRWKYDYLISMYVNSVFEGIKAKRWIMNEKTYSNVIKTNGHSYFGVLEGSDSLNGEVKEADDFVSSELLDYYLTKLITLAMSHDINVFWYTMPFNDASCEQVNPKLVDNFNRYIKSVGEVNRISVMRDIHCMDNQFFGDGSHVYRGSGKTTREILAAIE